MAGQQGAQVVVTAGPAPARRGGEAGWLAALRAPEWGLMLGLAVVVGLIYLLEPSHAFFTLRTQRALLHNIALFGVLSLGAAVVIISGGIDLSVGAVVALASVVAAKLMTSWLPGARTSGDLPIGVVAAACALTLLMGLVIGVAHAVMINGFRLPPFIATLATMAGLRSLAIILSQNTSINIRSAAFRQLGYNNYYTVPIFAAAAAAMSVMMGATVLGRHLYALGGNEAAARLSGLPTGRLKLIAYGLSGTLAALGGLLFAGNTGQGQGSTLGMAYELYAITAAVVGGCSLAGGVGSIRGTVLGLVLIQVVIKGTGLTVRSIDSSQIEGLVLGTVVVLAVAFNQRFRNRG